MAHLHNETVDGKNIVFYIDDNGVIWIRAYTLFHVAGIKSPGATLRSYIINHPGVGQKFSYPDNATGDVSLKFTSAAWHFTYTEALQFLNSTRAVHRIKARKVVDSTVQALTVAYLAPPAITPAKPAKAEAVPDTSNPLEAACEWLTGLLEETRLPYSLHEQALRTRAGLLSIRYALQEIK